MTEEELESSVLESAVMGSAVIVAPSVSVAPLSKEDRKELAMSRNGITDDVIFKTAYEGLTATKTVDEFDSQGNCKVVKVPDNIVRHKFLDSILRVKGYIRADASIENTVNFNLTVTERSAIRDRLKRVIDV